MPWFRAIQCWICDWIVDSLHLWTPQRLSCQPYPTMRHFIKPRIFAAILGVLKMRPTKWPKMLWFNYWEPGPKATNWMNVLSKILAVKQYETIWIHWNIKRSPLCTTLRTKGTNMGLVEGPCKMMVPSLSAFHFKCWIDLEGFDWELYK